MRKVPYWRLAGTYFFYFAYIGAFAPYFSLYLSSLGIAAAGIGVIMALPQLVRIVAPHIVSQIVVHFTPHHWTAL